MNPSSASKLIFVDASVDDYQSLIQDNAKDAQIIILHPDTDGVVQISQSLVHFENLKSIQIISHGQEGLLQLGATTLSAGNLSYYATQLQQWSKSLAAGADLLLYGCDVAAGQAGQAFVQQLGQLTGTDVAASIDRTGSADRGGNWHLEYTTGSIETSLALSPSAVATYAGTLNSFNVTSYQELYEAIEQANATDGDAVIQINGNISLEGALPTITSTIEFVGDAVISGSDLYRVFDVDAGNGSVRFTRLTIANGLAEGSNGTTGTSVNGSNGGMGRGGGLRIQSGNVTLVNVTFRNNQAIGGQGGGSLTSTGGTGGNGEGGAVYISGGSLRISSSSFKSNMAEAGLGGEGRTNGRQGLGKGGAIYVDGGTVIAERTPTFDQNTASHATGVAGDDNNIYGSLNVVVPPSVVSIARAQPRETAADVVSYVVTFDQEVSGVDRTDFEIRLAADATLVNAGILSVSGSGRVYTVEVSTGTGRGDLRLDLKDNDSIKSSSSEVPLGGTGTGNGNKPGETYNVDKTPPAVFAINRKEPSLSANEAVVFTVVFDQDVTGVDLQDFGIAATGVLGARVTTVQKVNNKTYDVTVNTGTGNGQLGLTLVDNDSIKNSRGVALGGTGTGNGNFLAGETYSIDKTPPDVVSIAAAGPNPTNASSIAYTVRFSQDVTGVDLNDFTLTTTGVRSASLASIQQVDSRTYTVLVNTGSNDGSIRLNLKDNDTVRNLLGVSLGGRGADNGNFAGQTYSIIKFAPIVTGINRVNLNPTAAGTIDYAVSFSQAVTGVDINDFALNTVGISGASIASVTGSGNNYNVRVNTGTGNGTLQLNLIDNDSIRNGVNAALGSTGANNGNFIGQTYAINKIPPRAIEINRLEKSPTNAATITFTAIFSENVTRVDAADFQLVTNGITGANISSVTRVNNKFYTIQVNTGRGDGTIGLNLKDNDSILNQLGTPLGGRGITNGNFIGQVYRVDKTNPIARIVSVSPNPRRDKVNALTIEFGEAVKGFDLSDLRLTRDGRAVDLSRATLSTDGGISWTLGNIKKLTNQKGSYVLSLAAGDSGITDAAGNPLVANLSERWTNLATVDACDPGIFRRGTTAADLLVGTGDRDTLLGSDGNDTLIGLDCGDRLLGGRGNDRLEGGEGNDQLVGGVGNDVLIGGIGEDFLKGGPGKDRFVFSSASSLVDGPDRVRDFKVSKQDKFQLADNNLGSRSRPRGLFHAGKVSGQTLAKATKAAYADRNQQQSGNQRLQGNEAVFFKWKNRTYLSVNDKNAGMAVNRDLVINVTGIQFKPGDSNAGVLTVNNYFI
jgi:Ca2+-binding RTX toxin-like protein